MQDYFISLAAGILIGFIYGLIGVRSPAPPAVALVGLLGMLIGGQIVPIAQRVWHNELSVIWFSNECAPRVSGVEHAALREKGRCLAEAIASRETVWETHLRLS